MPTQFRLFLTLHVRSETRGRQNMFKTVLFHIISVIFVQFCNLLMLECSTVLLYLCDIKYSGMLFEAHEVKQFSN